MLLNLFDMVTWPSRFAGFCQKMSLSFVLGQLIWDLSTIRPRLAPGSPIALDVPQRFLQALLHRSRSKRPCLRSQGSKKQSELGHFENRRGNVEECHKSLRNTQHLQGKIFTVNLQAI